MGASHVIDVIVEGARIPDWSGYHIESSMITAADQFELRRPFDPMSWHLLRRDAHITVRIDGTAVLDGFIDKRVKASAAGTMTISGRDRVGRLVDESAPAIDYSGMTLLAALQRLVSPWFERVTLSDARNRTLRKGKGKRLTGDKEPVETIAIRVPRRGVVHPGQSRWAIIHEIAARASLLAYSSADGKEIFFGKPNYAQDPQYVFRHIRLGSLAENTVRDLTITEDDGDRFSLIVCGGVGGQTDTNYGTNVTDHRGVSFDNVLNRRDGTGRDFIHPKRLYMPERDYESYGDAQRVADNERARRDYKRHIVSIEADNHGQGAGTADAVLFAPNTIARVIDEDQDPVLDDLYLIVSCSYSSEREQGEYTTMHLVPTGTEIIL